jgi:hypothetical protein
MVRVNADLKGRAMFQDISYVVEGGRAYWVAWYYRTVDFTKRDEVEDEEQDDGAPNQ